MKHNSVINIFSSFSFKTSKVNNFKHCPLQVAYISLSYVQHDNKELQLHSCIPNLLDTFWIFLSQALLYF